MLPDYQHPLLWLSLVLLLPTAVQHTIAVVGHLGGRRPVPDSGLAAGKGRIAMLKVWQPGPSRYPPRISAVLVLVAALLLLTFGGSAVYWWVARTTEFPVDFWTALLVLLLFVALPIVLVRDVIKILVRRPARSEVARAASITVANDTDTVFDACCGVLRSMHAAIRIMERPMLLKASVRNSLITIGITQIEESRVLVHVLSDAKWLTVRWDGGANQRNIDVFIQELTKQ